MDFSSVLEAARAIENKKEQSQLSIRLKEKSQEPSPKRFSKSKSVSKTKKANPKKRKAPSSVPILSIQKRAKPLSPNKQISTKPVNSKPTLKSITRVVADLVETTQEGKLFRQNDKMKDATVCVGGTAYQARTIHAFEKNGSLVLRLYTVWLPEEDLTIEPFCKIVF